MNPRLRLPSLRGAARGRALPWALFAVAAAAAVALAILWTTQRGLDQRREEVVDTTRRFLEALWNFSAETIERDVAEIRSYAVGGFADEVENTFGPQRVAAIRESGATSVGRVEDVFVQSLDGPSATAFGVVQQTVANESQETPRTDVLHIEVGLIETDDGWRVNSVDILQSPGGTAAG